MGKTKFTEARKAHFIELVERGNTIASICEGMQIDSSTYRHARRRDAAFATEVDDAKNIRNEFVVDALYQSALSGNVTAQIFYLCNRARDQWQSVNKIIAENRGQVDVSIDFSKLSTEQLRAVGQLIKDS